MAKVQKVKKLQGRNVTEQKNFPADRTSHTGEVHPGTQNLQPRLTKSEAEILPRDAVRPAADGDRVGIRGSFHPSLKRNDAAAL